MVERIERSQVLAYRAAAQGLHRDDDARAVDQLAVVDLGVQDTPAGSAATALAVRGAASDDGADALVTTWTLRGAPHVHRRSELEWWSTALWPWSDDDALARLDTSASPVRAAGMSGRDALRLVAEHVTRIVTEPMTKGEASTALTPTLPPELTVDCRPCQATHVVETLWRSAILPAGLSFVPSTKTVTFEPIAGWPGVPAETQGDDRLIETYLRLLGPAGPAEVAAFLGTRAPQVSARWPTTLAEVELDGERRWIPEDALGLLRSPPDPPLVRLLPPSDPWLQARDRELLVPDEAARGRLWPILGRPGAVLVRGEVAGSWRARKRGRRLAITVEPFGALSASVVRHLDAEAQLVASGRGAASGTVEVLEGPAPGDPTVTSVRGEVT